jgi:hypothetical protein
MDHKAWRFLLKDVVNKVDVETWFDCSAELDAIEDLRHVFHKFERPENVLS